MFRALHSASKERKIGDIEPESGFAASDISSDLFLSSQEESAPWGPRETKAHFVATFCEALAVLSVIQKDPLYSPKAEHLLPYFSVSNGSSVIVNKGHHADGCSVSLLWQPEQRTR